MYLVRDGSLYRAHGGYGREADIPVYPTKADIPQYRCGLVLVGPTELTPGFYRLRRGKYVEVPAEWVGRIPSPQTIRQRNSVSRRTRSGP